MSIHTNIGAASWIGKSRSQHGGLPDYVRDGGVSDLYSYDITGVADRTTELMGA